MDIHEIKNNTYKIEPIHMKNDSLIKGVLPPIPSAYNFYMIICGGPGSGKTCFFLNLINKKSKHTLYKKFDKIYIFSNSLHTIGEKIHLPEDRLQNGIGNLEAVIEEIKQLDDRVLFVFDDVISSIKDNAVFMELLFNRRHIGGGVSIVILTQVWNKLPLALRKVATEVVLFNTSNKKEFTSIFDDFVNIKRESFDAIIKYTFDKKHSFLFLDTINKLFYKNFNLLSFQE